MTREEALERVKGYLTDYIRMEDADEIDEIMNAIKPKTGHWIEHPHECGENWEYSMYECSECHHWVDDDSDYCPSCGAKMVEPQESEEE